MENRRLRLLRRLHISRVCACPENPEAVVDVPEWRNPLTWLYVAVGVPVAMLVHYTSKLWRR